MGQLDTQTDGFPADLGCPAIGRLHGSRSSPGDDGRTPGGDPAHLPLVKREAQWAEAFSAKGFKTWYYGYVMIFLAEYLDATGDASVRPGLRRLALEAAQGQSAVGSWGHDFARPDGRLKGYGMMNAPGLPLTIGLVRARDAGVSDPDVTRAMVAKKTLPEYGGPLAGIVADLWEAIDILASEYARPEE